MKPLVSVIIPTYNVGRYIEGALRSALGQTLGDLEVLVVDDASTDDTVARVKAHADPRVRLFVNEGNKGPSFSRNRAIAESRGEWIAVLDGDDWWAEDRLARLYETAAREKADLVCDDLYFIEDGAELPWTTLFRERGLPPTEGRVTLEPFIRWDLGLVKPFMHRQRLVESGVRYPEALRFGEDFVFLFTWLRRGASMWLVPEAYYYYRNRGESLVHDKIPLHQQVYDIAVELLAKVDRSREREVYRALSDRASHARQLVDYYRVVQPLKEKKIHLALAEALKNPRVIVSFLRLAPGVLRYHLAHRQESGGAKEGSPLHLP
ncbi:glycosyltransferase family 2 protein [Kyrpidia tusciae]|uniref:Glycosyl transferase family 2 n=1 Tax=Kyrpidia tusciae (strain DSM 2912 / NBRC 15312 / T2) TaxID=562970 RepID=D5WS02_KYRT2|nr:glycosyltransferase family 2 protein [Kyrpidia tusciae]ADG06954.1 glycosyl transferase family 2 [Kyrpidia tusciae DSM 2912]